MQGISLGPTLPSCPLHRATAIHVQRLQQENTLEEENISRLLDEIQLRVNEVRDGLRTVQQPPPPQLLSDPLMVAETTRAQ